MKKQNKVIAIIVIILLIVTLAFLIYNIIHFYNTSKIKNKKIVIQSVTDEKYILSSLVRDPIKGDRNAQISIYLFSDYETKETADILKIIEDISKRYPDKISLVWKDLPILTNRFSKSAALASRCAQEQNKYWEYNNELFNTQGNFSIDLYKNIAEKLKLDVNKFLSCYNSQKYLDDINYNIQEAYVLGVQEIPTIFINQNKFETEITYENLENVIKSMIK